MDEFQRHRVTVEPVAGFRLKYEITVVFDDRAGPDQSSALGKTLRWRLAFVTVHFTASLHELAHKLGL